MIEHPDITRTLRTGYPQPEPPLFSNCVCCGTEIFVGEEYIVHAENAFCDILCLTNTMFEEGNAERRIAE